METVEVVIKISKVDIEKVIQDIKQEGWYDEDSPIDRILYAVGNGTILPKNHGRLIDADAFERRCMFDSDIEDMQDVIYALRDYKTIIEADKAVENDD